MDLCQGVKELMSDYMACSRWMFNNQVGVSITDLYPLFPILGNNKGHFDSGWTHYNVGDHQVLNTDLAKVEKIIEDLNKREADCTSMESLRDS